jgi:hypothetical protein
MRRYYFTYVTSTGHILRSSNGAFENDRQAEIFARRLVDSTDPSIVAVEVWERSRLVRRIGRDHLPQSSMTADPRHRAGRS